jgi:hypothetical protein
VRAAHDTGRAGGLASRTMAERAGDAPAPAVGGWCMMLPGREKTSTRPGVTP